MVILKYNGFYYDSTAIFNERNIVNNIRIRKQSHSPPPRSPNSAVLPSALSFYLALRAQPRNILCVYEARCTRIYPYTLVIDAHLWGSVGRKGDRCASNVLTLAIVLLIYLPFYRGSRIFRSSVTVSDLF